MCRSWSFLYLFVPLLETIKITHRPVRMIPERLNRSPFIACALVRTIHDRMPVILPEEQQEAWLTGSLGKGDLQPFPAEAMKAWAVSTRVNSPKNNGPDLAEPVPVAQGSPDTSDSTENSR